MAKWLTGVAALLVILGGARGVRAEERVRLVYSRDESASECPEEPKLRRWVVARLGYDPFSAQAENVLVARITLVDQRLEGSVETLDRHEVSAGRRVLSSAAGDCQALARAMALSISLAIDPERASLSGPEQPEPEEAEAPAVAEPSAPPPVEPAAPPPVEPAARAPAPLGDRTSPPARARATVRVFTGAAFASNVAALPTAAFGGEVMVGLRREQWSLSLSGRGLQSFGRELEPRGQVTGALYGGGLNGCWHTEPIAACLVGQAALQRLSGSGVSDGRTSSGMYWAVGPRLIGHSPLSRELALMVALEGALNLAPNTAVLSGNEVWEVPIFAATLLVGVRAQFL